VSPRAARTAETLCAAVLWVTLSLGICVGALTVPVYTSALVQALKIPESAQLPIDDVVRLSGMVRALVADREFELLPLTWHGQPAFDPPAVSHLMDVRRVLDGARAATGAAAALLALYVGFSVGRRRWVPLAAGMRAGAYALLGVIVLAGAFALLDFESFFTAFHGLFFESGTWTFPYDSMLIRLFPERFWVASGVAWAALTAASAALLFVGARVLPSGASGGAPVALREEVGSRMADNV